MIRKAKVLKQNKHAVTLELVRNEKCVGCPKHCNEPLIDLFALKKNSFTLSPAEPGYQLVDPKNLLSKPGLVDQVIAIAINPNDLLKSSLFMYIVPLLVCLVCLILGHLIGAAIGWHADLMALLGLLTGLYATYLLARSKIAQRLLKFRPKVTILG